MDNGQLIGGPTCSHKKLDRDGNGVACE
ncbi:excalibur calcium-binding domain-containing protein [Paenibacillus graminis]